MLLFVKDDKVWGITEEWVWYLGISRYNCHFYPWVLSVNALNDLLTRLLGTLTLKKQNIKCFVEILGLFHDKLNRSCFHWCFNVHNVNDVFWVMFACVSLMHFNLI